MTSSNRFLIRSIVDSKSGLKMHPNPQTIRKFYFCLVTIITTLRSVYSHECESVRVRVHYTLRRSKPSSTVCLKGPISTSLMSCFLTLVSSYRRGCRSANKSRISDGLLWAAELNMTCKSYNDLQLPLSREHYSYVSTLRSLSPISLMKVNEIVFHPYLYIIYLFRSYQLGVNSKLKAVDIMAKYSWWLQAYG